jgi:hypothetical protein
MSSLPLPFNGFQQRTFPFFWIPDLSPASAATFSQQSLTTASPSGFLTNN